MEKRLVVLGGGPAGYTAALRAVQLGAQVTLIEEKAVGGTCLHQGCIPLLVFLEAAHLLARIRRAPALGLRTGEASLDLPALQGSKKQLIARLQSGVEALLARQGVKVVRGKGALLDRWTIGVGGEEIRGDALILAPGSVPHQPPTLAGALDSAQALELREIPKSVLVIGGGMVGVELAQFFLRAGARVGLVEAEPQLLPGEDPELAGLLGAALREEGMEVRLGTAVEKADGHRVSFTGGEVKDAEVVIAAVGRQPRTQGLGLESIGLGEGSLAVDDRMETVVQGVYACGDSTGAPMLAHRAMAGGRWAATAALGLPVRADFSLVPRCLFTEPEFAAVGMREEEARERFGQVRVGRFPFSASARAQALGEARGLAKVIAEPRYGQVLGVHLLGPGASEVISQAVLALGLEATAEAWAQTILPHPTLSEALAEAVWDLEGRAIHI